MTKQEIERKENAIRHIASSLDVDQWAYEEAKLALQKQIPVVPTDRSGLGIFNVKTGVCPVCSYRLTSESLYCCKCGQAIEWE